MFELQIFLGDDELVDQVHEYENDQYGKNDFLGVENVFKDVEFIVVFRCCNEWDVCEYGFCFLVCVCCKLELLEGWCQFHGVWWIVGNFLYLVGLCYYCDLFTIKGKNFFGVIVILGGFSQEILESSFM